MKNQTRNTPTAGKFSLLRQICNFIPPHLVPKLARDTGVEKQWRRFSPWSHVVSLLYAQLTHSLGLNDVCDALRLPSGPLSALRGATAPPKNTLSHANRTRDPKMAEQLFWAGLDHWQTLQPAFGGKRRPRFAFRFKRLWQYWELRSLLILYGTAGGGGRFLGTPQQADLAGFG